MSHFNVAVFTRTDDPDELEQLLAPYDECVESNSPYAEFEEDEDGELDERTGKRGYWSNPNAKYDWYMTGGRWRGQLRLKEGKTGRYGECSWTNKDTPVDPTRCDCAKVRDCDFTPNEAARAHATRFWEVYVEGKPLHADEKRDNFVSYYNKRYYIEKYGTKERYAESCARFSTHSYLAAIGEWEQVGQMGWFGMDDSTDVSRQRYEADFAEYLKEAEEQDLYITIVDCHI